MPIDANIYSAIQPVAPANPLQTLAQVYALKGAQQNQRINELQIEDLHASRAQALQKAQEDFAAAQLKREQDQKIINLSRKGPLTIENLSAEDIPTERAQTLVTGQENLIKLRNGNAEDVKKAIVQTMGGILKAPSEMQQALWTDARTSVVTNYGAKPEEIPEQFSQGWMMSKLASALTPQELSTLLKPDPKSFGPGPVYDQNDPEAFKKPPLLVVGEQPKAPQSEDFFLDGKNVKGAFVPMPDGSYKLMYNGEDVTSRAQRVKPERDPLAQELAQARLDAAKEKAAPLNITESIRTTEAGGKFVDLSQFSAGPERDKARDAAYAAGAIPVSKEQADALSEVDTARKNQANILDQVKDLLPKDAFGRPFVAAGTKISQFLQTDAQKAAFGTWRNAAINTLRATAGSKGLRINKAEIEQAVETDIPKLTDTWETAQQKVKNVNLMLDNAESSIIPKKSGAAGGADKEGATKEIPGYPGTEQTYRNGKWIRTK